MPSVSLSNKDKYPKFDSRVKAAIPQEKTKYGSVKNKTRFWIQDLKLFIYAETSDEAMSFAALLRKR